MKLLIILNALGLDTPTKKVAFALKQLIAGTLPSPKALVKAATAVIPAIPAVAAVAATPAVAAVAAVVGTGTIANPQFPPRPAVPAVAAIPARPLTPAVPAKPAVYSPVVTPLPQWLNSIAIDTSNAAYDKIMAYLPYAPAAIALGKQLDVTQILEITTPNLFLGEWQGSLVGVTPTNEPPFVVAGLPGTIEQFLYAAAKALPALTGTTNKITTALYRPTAAAPAVPVVALELYLPKMMVV